MESIMRFKDFKDHDFLDIARSDMFYDALIGASRLSDLTHESSFCVHADDKGFRITKPLKEFSEFCQAGADNETGFTYSKPGYGLHIPKKRFPLFKVHFHTTDNNAIPSFDDITNNLYHGRTPINTSRGLDLVLEVAMIGLRVNTSNLLFTYQANGQENFEDIDSFSRDLDSMISNCVYKKGQLDKSIKAVYDTAAIMRNTGRYRANVIYFKDRKDYMSKIRFLAGFQLSVPVKDMT